MCYTTIVILRLRIQHSKQCNWIWKFFHICHFSLHLSSLGFHSFDSLSHQWFKQDIKIHWMKNQIFHLCTYIYINITFCKKKMKTSSMCLINTISKVTIFHHFTRQPLLLRLLYFVKSVVPSSILFPSSKSSSFQTSSDFISSIYFTKYSLPAPTYKPYFFYYAQVSHTHVNWIHTISLIINGSEKYNQLKITLLSYQWFDIHLEADTEHPQMQQSILHLLFWLSSLT